MSIRPSTPCSRNSPIGSGSWRARSRRTPRPGSGRAARRQRVYLDHAFDVGAYNPCFPEYTFDHLDDETGIGPRHLPGGLRRSAGTGERRLSRRLLRLHHPTPELRGQADGQDALAHGDVPSAHADPHRTSLRHRAVRRRRQGDVDGAAAAGRRGALHRRVQDGGVSHRTN